MKLLIISHTVVKGGKIKERGDVYDTQVDKGSPDREAYELIACQRALDVNTPEAKEILSVIEDEKKTAAEAAKAEKAKK